MFSLLVNDNILQIDRVIRLTLNVESNGPAGGGTKNRLVINEAVISPPSRCHLPPKINMPLLKARRIRPRAINSILDVSQHRGGEIKHSRQRKKKPERERGCGTRGVQRGGGCSRV